MLTWEETDEELVRLYKEYYDFYEAHELKEIRASAELLAWVKNKRAECVVVHTRRIQLNIERHKHN
jgi:hypothetical protein